MAFIFRRRAAARHRTEFKEEEASRLLVSPEDRASSLRRDERGGVSAISVIVALLILIAVLGLMLASGI